MPVSPQHPSPDSFTLGYVRKHARQLVGRYGFAPSDQQEIEQRLLLKLTPRLPEAKADCPKWKSFVAKTVKRHIATLIRDAVAEKRAPSRCGSLNVSVHGEDGPVELIHTLGPDQAGARLQRSPRSDEQLAELRMDMAAIIASLPPDLRDVCVRLQHDSISQVARDLGVPRTTLSTMIGRLRERFDKGGLREFL
jgi:RNA polymerase sigma-70 factor (ECF subfamily)